MIGYILSAIYIVFILFLINRFQRLQPPGVKFIYVALFFILKCCIGILLGIFYRKHYGGGDTFGFFSDSGQLFSILFNDPINFFRIIFGLHLNDPEITRILSTLHLWDDSGFDDYYNDARTVVKINAIIRFFSFGYYEVHVVWMNFLAYLGLLWLYKVFVRSSHEDITLVKWYYFIPFFLPSVIIWGSGLLKEPIIIFFLGALFRTFQLLSKYGRIRFLLLSFILIISFFFVKAYIILMIVPGLIGYFIYSRINSVKPYLIIPCTYLAILFLVLFLGNFSPNFDLPSLLFGKQLNSWRFAIFMNAGSLIHPVPFAPNAISFLKHFPQACWFALARPYLTELKEFWMAPFSFEWIILSVLLFYRFITGKINQLLLNPKAIFVCCAAISILGIIGFTNPVLGNIVRYRLVSILLIGLAFISNLPSKKINDSNDLNSNN